MIIPDGTRDVLPPEWAWREHLRARLHAHFAAWGYRGVELPALELQDPRHPQDARAFKLIDRDGQVLALRSEFTTAIGRLVRARFPKGPYPLRLQYSGRLWLRAQTSELGRLREFTQVGVELVGVSTPQADAELLELAGSALAAVGVPAQLEVGHPGFLDAILEDAGVVGAAREGLHAAIDRKSGPDLSALLAGLGLGAELERTLHTLTDLYGGPEVLEQARALPLGPGARAALAHLGAVAGRHGPGRLIYDLGMSRRYDYYSGFTFRAYAQGDGQGGQAIGRQILGGGRYDAGIPGAGFALGLERLTGVAARHLPGEPELVLALDLDGLRFAQGQGLTAELAWTDNPAELGAYSQARGIRRWVRGGAFMDAEVTA